GENLHERALAGTVLADECVDLAGQQLERDAVQGLRRPEPLRDVAQLGARGHGVWGRGPGRHHHGERLPAFNSLPATPREGSLAATRRTSTPLFRRPSTIVGGASRSVTTAARSVVGQKVANAVRPHFVWSTSPTVCVALSTMRRLICASS